MLILIGLAMVGLLFVVTMVLIMGVTLWQLGIFNLGEPALTVTGFAKLKPQLAACGVTEYGEFDCIFTNGAGTKIIVDQYKSTITVDDVLCNTIEVEPETGEIPVGSNFMITAENCATGEAGSPYRAEIKIAYNVTIGTHTSQHSDSGIINGVYE